MYTRMRLTIYACNFFLTYNLSSKFYLQSNFHNELPLKNEHPPMEKQGENFSPFFWSDLSHLLELEKDN